MGEITLGTYIKCLEISGPELQLIMGEIKIHGAQDAVTKISTA
jgi:hypothetical protein